MLQRFSAVLLAIVLLAVLSPSEVARGQATDASVIGSVRDEQGAPVSGASITLKNAATGGTWTVVTRASGRFAFVQLPLGGPYEVTARSVGAMPVSRTGYHLTLGSRVLVD